jgi:hypothetical protein
MANGLVRTIGFSLSELTERRESQIDNPQLEIGNDFTLPPLRSNGTIKVVLTE